MTNQYMPPDINVVLADLSLQIANLTRENAILKATLQATQTANQSEKSGKNEKLQR